MLQKVKEFILSRGWWKLKMAKNHVIFEFVQIWCSCRCDMKIIFGAFDNLDIKLLSHKNFCHHLLCMLSQIGLKVKNAKKICEKNFKKSSNTFSRRINCPPIQEKKIDLQPNTQISSDIIFFEYITSQFPMHKFNNFKFVVIHL